ncbi:hypothetical protein BX600DRAFT_514817 [Xylariales sp. PMI_506]|nr:hypothetical protein BX600DRAFT_514817 [Xylariales sp. PMI_506]
MRANGVVERRSVTELYAMTAPAPEALSILRELREAGAITNAAPRSPQRLLGMQRPSDIRTARAVSPPTFSALEFELMACHHIAYPPIPPLELTALSPFAPLVTAPVLDIINFQTGGRGGSQEPLNWDSETGQQANTESSTTQMLVPDSRRRTADRFVQMYAGPRRLDLCDNRLHQLRIGYWTGVSIADEVAASVVSHYLEVNHPVLGFFDADTFIDDAVNQRLRYCSPFLIDALFSFACRSYAIIDSRVSDMAPAFLASAERMWLAERSSDSLTNVSALLLLSAGCHIQEGSLSVLDILHHTRTMCKRMALLDTPRNVPAAANLDGREGRYNYAAAHVAWGAYNWLTLNMYYMPIIPFELPPMFPIPGDDSDLVGDAIMHMQWPPRPIPSSSAGQTFVAVCKFWTIMQEIGVVYFAHRSSPTSSPAKVPLSFAESKYQKLLEFASSLTEGMARRDHIPDHIVAFHILFHSAVIDIFQPFLEDDAEAQRLRSFSSAHSSASAAVRASTNQLQRLIMVCRLQNPRTASLVITNTALVHVGNIMLRDAAIQARHRDSGNNDDDAGDSGQVREFDPLWHFYFSLCIKSGIDVSLCFPIIELVTRGLLTMAVRDGALKSSEARAWIEEMEKRQVQSSTHATNIGDFIVDLSLSRKSYEDSLTKTLAAKFDEMAMFDDLTVGQDLEREGVQRFGQG